MKVLSLFDGISCARVALERAGIRVEKYYASEIDKYAIQIAQKNYPDTIQLGDIKDLCSEEGLRRYLPEIDLMIGGSPCQDLSIAKKNREGLSGSRSSLFWNYVLLLKYVKPKYFILENVASMPREAKQIITETLGVEPIMIDAALVSAQRRKRLFWTNIPNVKQPDDRGIFLKDILEDGIGESVALRNRGNGKKPEYNKTGKANALTTVQTDSMVDSVYQYRRTYWRETKGGKVPVLTANMGTGGNNVPYVEDKSYCVPSTYYKENVKSLIQRKKNGLLINVPYVALTERRTEEAKKIRSEYRKKTGKDFSPRRGKELVPRSDGKMNTITTGTKKESLLLSKYGIRKLTPIECERLQSLPDKYTEGVSTTQRYKALGNAFNVDVVAHILRHI